MKQRTSILMLAIVVVAACRPAMARIKLATLPVRERVEIQLDHGQATLVEEERIVPLLASSAKTGNNRIDFSWSNTSIDKDSIQLRPLAIRQDGAFRPVGKVGGRDEIRVINVSYPPGENALVWDVYAARACAAKVRVSYLIGNLTRAFSYRALTNRDETELTLRCFLQLRNYSGEHFGTAGVWAGFGPGFNKQVGQQEEIKMLLRRFDRVPVRKTFTFDWYAHGALNPAKPLASRVLMHYEIVNDEKHQLGAFPLPAGKVRIFIDDGHQGEAFLGEDRGALTPLDDTLRLYVGESRDIVCTRIVEKNTRHALRGNLFDQELIIKYEIENYKTKPCTLDIVEQINRVAKEYGRAARGDAEWEIGPATSEGLRCSFKQGNAVPRLYVDLPARPADRDQPVEKTVVRLHLTIKNLW